jgi:hypothetical protein
VKKVFPGTKVFSRHFDAVVVYLHKASELNFIKDILTQYQDAPIKAFLGKEHSEDAAHYHAKSYLEGDANTLVGELSAKFNELSEVIQKVFKSFDKDNSGYIDISELKDVSSELGRPMDAAELEECMKDLDQNKDGKISYEEFSAWWLSGRQGLSGWMRTLLSFKLKTMKFVDSVSGTMQEVVAEASSAGNSELATNSVSININKVEHSGFSASAKICLLSPEAKKAFEDIQAVHRFEEPIEDPAYISTSIEIRNGTAAEVVSKIDTMLEGDFWKFFPLKSMISYIANGNKLEICFRAPSKLAPLIEPYKDILHVIQNELQVDQSIEASVRLAAKPTDLLAEGGEAVLMQLLDGISIDVKLNLWKKVSDFILKLIENGNYETKILSILGGIAPAFLLRMNLSLDIGVDEFMKNKIRENPLVEPVLMDASSLISSVSGRSFENEDEFSTFVSESIPPPFNEVAAIFAKHLGDRVDFTVAGPYGAIKAHVDGEGLHLILQNGLKFFNP